MPGWKRWARRCIPARSEPLRERPADGRRSPRESNRAWALVTSALLGALVACALLGCAVRPTGIGESPGDYEAFVREVMAQAGKTPGAPKPAARATQRAGEWLGAGEGSGGTPVALPFEGL